MFRTILCIPPDYDHVYPPLGTPVLAAFLKKHGFGCLQIDLNLGYRDFLAAHITGQPPLSMAGRRSLLEPLLYAFFSQKLKNRYYSALLPRTGDGIFPHLPYGNNTNSSFYFTERLLSSEHLWRYLEDSDENTFLQYYMRSGFPETIEREGAGLLGISLTSPSQAVAGLTLGLYVKRLLPRLHVTIGGQWVTLYRDAILQRKDFFRCFDSIIPFEGESALCGLAQRLSRGEDVAALPGVLTAGQTSGSAVFIEEDLESLPCPDFDGLPLDAYDGNKDGEVSLTYEASRGCYWGKCAYCVDLPLPKPSYRRKPPAAVAGDMSRLKRRYGAGYLLFGDPGLSPRHMREIARHILENGVEMEWWTMARLDPGFDRGLFGLARKAGLRQVNFGFESASDRVCGLLAKGNLAAVSSRVIRDCASAGIRVDLQTMLGLPGESLQDGMETVDFLLAHKDFITHVTFNTYYLTPSNFVYRDPARYGIEIEPRPDMPFAFFIPFRNIRGMDMEQAEQLEKVYRGLAARRQENAGGMVRPGDGPRGWAELRLNGESCRLRYARGEAADSFMVIDDENTS